MLEDDEGPSEEASGEDGDKPDLETKRPQKLPDADEEDDLLKKAKKPSKKIKPNKKNQRKNKIKLQYEQEHEIEKNEQLQQAILEKNNDF